MDIQQIIEQAVHSAYLRGVKDGALKAVAKKQEPINPFTTTIPKPLTIKKEKKPLILCSGETREGEQCEHVAAHKDGLCGVHHKMKKEGKKMGLKEKTKAKQCLGHTKKGKRCHKTTLEDDGYCHLHSE